MVKDDDGSSVSMEVGTDSNLNGKEERKIPGLGDWLARGEGRGSRNYCHSGFLDHSCCVKQGAQVHRDPGLPDLSGRRWTVSLERG